MAVKEVIVCDKCGETIKSRTGVEVKGSILVVTDDETSKGLVGGNPECVSHYHNECLVKILFKGFKLVQDDNQLMRQLTGNPYNSDKEPRALSYHPWDPNKQAYS